MNWTRALLVKGHDWSKLGKVGEAAGINSCLQGVFATYRKEEGHGIVGEKYGVKEGDYFKIACLMIGMIQ